MMSSYGIAKSLLRYGLVTILLFDTVHAANFELSKFIEVGATTTNNLTLADSEANRVNDEVFNVTPSVELKFSGNRFGIIALGQVEYYHFNDSQDYIVDPSLFLRARGTLIDNFLFIDSTLALTKTGADNSFLRPTDGGETAASSKTTTYVEHSFGQFADLYTGYTFGKYADRVNEELETDEHTIELSLQRNPIYNGFLWGIGGYFGRDESEVNIFEDSYAYGKLGATFNQNILAEVTYGVENRKFVQNANTDNPTVEEFEDTPLWNFQLTWSPGELTTFSIGYGDRFFGAGPNLLFKRKIQNSALTASYTRDVSRQAATLDRIAPLLQILIRLSTTTNAVEINNPDNLTPLDQPFIDNRFQLGYRLAGLRSDLIADLVYSDQESLDGSDTIESILARVAFDRRLSDFLSIRLQYDYQRSEANNRQEFNYIENRLALKLRYSFDGNDRFEKGEFELD